MFLLYISNIILLIIIINVALATLRQSKFG